MTRLPRPTALELLAVALAALLVMSFVSPERFRVTLDKRAAAHDDMNAIRAALETYRFDNDDYPTTQQGLDALYRKPIIAPRPERWIGPYITNGLPRDPWGTPYVYVRSAARTYTLTSLGPERLHRIDASSP